MMHMSFARGSAPVGEITELPPLEAAVVMYLRLWCESHETRQHARKDFETVLGADLGRKVSNYLEQLCEMCAYHGHRPLMHHHVSCKCLGADESCLANFVAAATEGNREDAFIFAQHIVRPDVAMCLIDLAQRLGIGLQRMKRKAIVAASAVDPSPLPKNLH